MSKEKVKLILVVDASSSMSMTKQETIDAVEKLIDEHRLLKDKKVRVQIYTFDNVVKEVVPLTKLKDYQRNFSQSYITAGMTALYDAIGKAVTDNKENDSEFAKTSLVILTDGQENSSREYSKKDISNLLTSVQDGRGWDVSYIGAQMANFDDYTASLGLKMGKSLAIDPNQAGTRGMSLNAASTMSMAYMSSDANSLKATV